MNKDIIIFAGGCFGGLESSFYDLDGVIELSTGYMGGKTKNPIYEEVCKNNTGHAEVVQIIFDTSILSLDDLLRIFFKSHNASGLSHKKEQYRSAIFSKSLEQKVYLDEYIKKLKLNKSVNTIVEHGYTFYEAEERHQHYYKKHKPRRG